MSTRNWASQKFTNYKKFNKFAQLIKLLVLFYRLTSHVDIRTKFLEISLFKLEQITR